MVWNSHLFQNFPQFIVIHIVKGFGIVNKAEIDAFLELSCFGTTICMFSQLQTSVTKYMRFFFRHINHAALENNCMSYKLIQP